MAPSQRVFPIAMAPGARAGVDPRLRSVLGGSVGNLIEWFDFHIYVAFSLFFAKQFFPGDSATVQYISTAGIFALGFLLRPLGSWVFGIYADRHGRRAGLTLTVTMMCAGSMLIAICPTYRQVGAWAPALLLIARMIQGLSLGGEYASSAVYLTEIASPGRRGFYSSFNYVTLISGQLLATLLLLVLQRWVLTPAQLGDWGWRIPFVIGALGSMAAWQIRRGIEETAPFQRQAVHTRRPIRELLRRPRALALVAGMTVGGTVAFFTYTVYMHRFLKLSVGLTSLQTTLVSSATLFLFMLLQPVFGGLSDRIGRKPLLLGFGALGTLGTVPILTAMTQTHDAWVAFGLLTIALVILSGYTSVNSVVKAELFPANVRALGVGLPYAIVISLFGGTAEYAGLRFKEAGHETWFFWYVSLCILCTFLTTLTLTETRTHSEIDADAVSG